MGLKFKSKLLEAGDYPTDGNIRVFGRLLNKSQLVQDQKINQEYQGAFTALDKNYGIRFLPVSDRFAAKEYQQQLTADNTRKILRMLNLLLTGLLREGTGSINLRHINLADYGITQSVGGNLNWTGTQEAPTESTDANQDSWDKIEKYVYASYAGQSYTSAEFIEVMAAIYQSRYSLLGKLLENAMAEHTEYETFREAFFSGMKNEELAAVEFKAIHRPEDAFMSKLGENADAKLQTFEFDMPRIMTSGNGSITFKTAYTALSSILTDQSDINIDQLDAYLGNTEERVAFLAALEFTKYLVDTGTWSFNFMPILPENYARYYAAVDYFFPHLETFLEVKYRKHLPAGAIGSIYGDNPELREIFSHPSRADTLTAIIMKKIRLLEKLEPEIFSPRLTVFGSPISYDSNKNHILEYYQTTEPGLLIEYMGVTGNLLSRTYLDSSTRNVLLYDTNAATIIITPAAYEAGIYTRLDAADYPDMAVYIFANYPQADVPFRVNTANIHTFLQQNDWFDSYSVEELAYDITEADCQKADRYWYLARCHSVLPSDELVCRMFGYQWWLDNCHDSYPGTEDVCENAGFLWMSAQETCVDSDPSEWDKDMCENNGWFYINNQCVTIMPGQATCLRAGYRWINNLCVLKEGFSRYACEEIGAWFFHQQCFYYPPYDELTCKGAGYKWYNGRCNKNMPDDENTCGEIGGFWYNNICNEAMPETRFSCILQNWYWYSNACHSVLPNTKAECDELYRLWYMLSCTELLPNDKDICENLGYPWYENACHADMPVEQPVCETAGYIWNNERCYMMIADSEEYSAYVCTEVLGRFYYNGTCTADIPVTEVDCLEVGDPYMWYDNTCTTEMPGTEAGCLEINGTWLNGTCYKASFFSETSCLKLGLKWYNNECHPVYPDTEADCLAGSLLWYESACHAELPATLSGCDELGYFFYGGSCHPELPRFRIPCQYYGFHWDALNYKCTEL